MPEVTFIGAAALHAKAVAACTRAVEQSAEDLVAAQMAAAPVDTGTLRASIHVESIETSAEGASAITSTGGESSAYAIFVHEGTGAHIIEAKGGGLMWPGAEHPVKVVHHPGTHPDKYMSGPLIANTPVYLAALSRAAAGEF